MVGTYDGWLLLLSVIVAITASYVALDLVSRVAGSRGRPAQWYWLTGGAIAMGAGIWAMHFIGMLAFQLPTALLENAEDVEVVGHAANGRDAVREIERLKPDIVLMDVAMPELNGIEATRLLGETSPATRVIVLSMYSDVRHVYRALKAGARGYLLRASTGREPLLGAIRSVHAGSRYLSPRVTEVVLNDYLREDSFADPLDILSARERQVLQLCVEGKPVTAIAEALSVSPRTVETYRSRLMEKVNITDLPALVKFAVQQGITPLE